MTDNQGVPELSLKAFTHGHNSERQKFIEDLFNGLKYYGFIILKDHPISKELLDKAYDLSQKLFDLPLDKKNSYVGKENGGQRGYTAFGTEHAKDNPAPDLKEFWHIGNELTTHHKYYESYPKNIWPKELSEFKSTYMPMYDSLMSVGEIILSALTQPLKVEPNYFSEMIQDSNSIVRLLHYPPIPEDADPNCVRAAAHEDINLITILVSASASGLELLDREGHWLPIETQANNLIVDAGDMLARITNDVIPSTTHRVINPSDGKNVSRYSMPFFIHPNPRSMLKCIPSCRGAGKKYPDILAEDFLQQRLKEIGLT